MAKLREADFYYGAVLSTLLNKGFRPALIEGGDDRQVYDFTTDDREFRMFIKYRSTPIDTKTEDYFSWQFILTDNDLAEINQYLQSGKEFSLGLVCGAESLKDSLYAVLRNDQIEQLLEQGKTNFTISIRKRERYFRIPISGGRSEAIRVKASDLY